MKTIHIFETAEELVKAFQQARAIGDVMYIINQEIKACKEHDMNPIPPDYKKGFVEGLLQAKILLYDAHKAINPNQYSEVDEDFHVMWNGD